MRPEHACALQRRSFPSRWAAPTYLHLGFLIAWTLTSSGRADIKSSRSGLTEFEDSEATWTRLRFWTASRTSRLRSVTSRGMRRIRPALGERKRCSMGFRGRPAPAPRVARNASRPATRHRARAFFGHSRETTRTGDTIRAPVRMKLWPPATRGRLFPGPHPPQPQSSMS